jgi:glutaredoxin 3
MPLELYGTRTCPYTAELRDELEWRGTEFVEFDVERDEEALRRLAAFCSGSCSVPVLVENGRVVQTGVGGRACFVASPTQ